MAMKALVKKRIRRSPHGTNADENIAQSAVPRLPVARPRGRTSGLRIVREVRQRTDPPAANSPSNSAPIRRGGPHASFVRPAQRVQRSLIAVADDGFDLLLELRRDLRGDVLRLHVFRDLLDTRCA